MSAPAAAAAPGHDAGAAARTFVETLARHEWQKAALSLDKTLTAPTTGEGATAKTLETFWGTVEGKSSFKGVEGVGLARRGNLDVAIVVCRFADKVQVVRVSLTADQHVAGLFQGSVKELAEPDARTLVEALAAHDVTVAHEMFAPAFRARVTEQELGTMWAELEKELGAFEKIEHVEVGATAKTRATVTVKFAKAERDVLVGFDDNGDVVGLKVQLATPAWEPPAYVKASAVKEQAVALSKPEVPGFVELPGYLTMPVGASGPVPGVVLIHRDGPQDEDESVGAIRPFKDFAWGLASRGIAVLRFKKRDLADISGEVTEKTEVFEPAMAAVDALKATSGVDPARVVVIGHGRGGTLAPIVAREAKLKGAALLAAPTRSFAENVLEQLNYLAALDPKNDLKAPIEAWKKLRTRVDDPKLDRTAKIELPSGQPLPGAYFVFARDIAPVQAAAAFSGALFIAQGGRDFQVGPTHLAEWRKALAKAPKATFKTYPKLGHLFTPSTGPGKPSPADYDGAKHVDEQLVSDLAAWITKL